MDTTLLLLALLTSLAVNAVLTCTLLLTVRGSRRRHSASDAAAAAASRPFAALTAAPALAATGDTGDTAAAASHGASPAPSRRAGIVQLLARGIPGKEVAAATGSTPGEIDLVARLVAFEQRRRNVARPPAAGAPVTRRG